MANSVKTGVWIVDTDGALSFTGPVTITSVVLKSDNTNAATLILKDGGVSGTNVYSTAVPATTTVPHVANLDMRVTDLYADIGGTGAVAYIYFE